jgi:diacylglycerol O-acyltransferase / wax synthase
VDVVDRMSVTDAGFYFAESNNTPLHVGSVAVFEGPAPSYDDVVGLLLGKLHLVPRYRQVARAMPLLLGRPVWVDDPHFNIGYHVRHTAVPAPGGREELRALTGRVLGQRLDFAKPLWELWLVDGLADGRWAVINKLHHCLVDGVAGTDVMALIFDLAPDAEHTHEQAWTPAPAPSTPAVLADALAAAVAEPLRLAAGLPGAVREVLGSPGRTGSRLATLAGGIAQLGGQARHTTAAAALNGPIGPHRRWTWADCTLDDVRAVRSAFGGTVNDVVLTAITAGFRDLLRSRGDVAADEVVRSMVPVSIRSESERGALDNRVSTVFVDLPVGAADPVGRLALIRRQMDGHKEMLRAFDPAPFIAAGDLVPTSLLALGTHTLLRTSQPWAQAVTTNVPGPPFPLYLLGRPMVSLYPCVPIGSGVRISIGIFSYLAAFTFGINVDYDAVPDVDVLTVGIERGMAELVALARQAVRP